MHAQPRVTLTAEALSALGVQITAVNPNHGMQQGPRHALSPQFLDRATIDTSFEPVSVTPAGCDDPLGV
jgi:hypothetical protein